MQQRVSVARAPIIGPDVLLMDETFSSLDELTAMTMREQLLELWNDLGCTVVFVTHNPLEATLLADRVVVMSAGPGRITDTLDLKDRLPRPRDPDDASLWRESRDAVRSLRGGAHGG
jgi:ABC-type nitrate/sulfonate/bicarbonate transport system ATPase subunit